MNTIFKFATLTLMMFAVSVCGFSATKPENLVRGVIGPVTSNNSWSGYSVLAQVPGAGLIPVTSATTAFYLGFTAGTQADVNNMVLYTTARGSLTITAVTPVTLGGISNPMINLANPTVCPVVEISAFNPCIVRLDPTHITLSAVSDYYLVVYFTASDSNNSALGLAQASFGQSSLSGTYVTGDESRLSVGASLPSNLGFNSRSIMLMYVMTN
jgi:hypothetical protein